jgi:hypothetical protein
VAVGTSGATVCDVYDKTGTKIVSTNGLHPLTGGVFDVGGALEDPAHPGYWKTNGTAYGYTGDGIHPSGDASGSAGLGYQTFAALVTTLLPTMKS